MEGQERLMTTKDVLAFCQFSTATLYRLIGRGEFPPGFLLGVKARRWRLSDLQKHFDTLGENGK